MTAALRLIDQQEILIIVFSREKPFIKLSADLFSILQPTQHCGPPWGISLGEFPYKEDGSARRTF